MEKIDAYRTSDGEIFYNEAEASAHQEKLDGIKTYRVTLYYTGSFNITVKAPNKAEALHMAREEDYFELWDIDEDVAAAEVEEVK